MANQPIWDSKMGTTQHRTISVASEDVLEWNLTTTFPEQASKEPLSLTRLSSLRFLFG
jgi:hypothetical protein